MVTLDSSRDAALPFVTYYDDATGERTELSATSLRNWQSKTANYLRDGLGLSRGDRIALDLPPHWVVPVWIAAARWIGASLTIGCAPADPAPDVAVVGPSELDHLPAADTVVACSLRPLAQPFVTPPAAGIDDYFAEVRSYGDHFSGPSISPGADEQDRVRRLISKLHLTPGDRIMVTAPVLSAQAAIALYDVPLAIGGSVVIVANATPGRIAAIATQERVTSHPTT